jgi:hypothetical protein
MSYGSNGAVEDAEDDYKEQCAQLIAETAAKLVAARDMSRSDAIKAATEWVRRENEAEGDLTQVASIENELPEPRLAASLKQVNAIASELLDAAREAADTL